MTTARFSRRQAMFAGAALPFAPMLMTGSAEAAVPLQGPAMPLFHRAKVGAFEVTTLLAGSREGDKPQETFGMNVPVEEFAAVSAANFIPADRTFNSFAPVLVNTGAELVLFDSGLSPEGITGALAAAGIASYQVDVVVLTHMHGDHIGGLGGANPTFANARYVTGAVEHNDWAKAGNEGFDTNVKPLNDRFSFLDDGGAVVSGITAMAAPGHTPGHFAYRDWEVRFDQDKAQAAATRRKVLGMLAADRIAFAGYHMPFPGIGFVETAGEGFRYVPASYQFMFG